MDPDFVEVKHGSRSWGTPSPMMMDTAGDLRIDDSGNVSQKSMAYYLLSWHAVAHCKAVTTQGIQVWNEGEEGARVQPGLIGSQLVFIQAKFTMVAAKVIWIVAG